MHSASRYLTLFILFSSFLIGISNSAISQETIKEGQNILSIANSIFRADDRLLNGKYYRPKHFFAEGHPYFLSNEWVDATLYIKGIQYNNIPLKYNIEDDNLIIKAIFDGRISKDILLHNSFVDSLIIGYQTFHNTNNFELENSIGIAEIVYKGEIFAYIKHYSEFKDEISERLRYGKYLESQKILYLFDGNFFHQIKKKKDLLNYFQTNKNEVKAFMRKNKIRFKKASSNQIVNLIHFCDNL
ncbi:MAG: hypothetical protein PF484_00925 [Bacteroidales bacterium]|jgi:hypothetical protein|nr:hypothetical protein [Bacteroidales bacterium]